MDARHTVSVTELRRVLASSPTSPSGAQRPSLATAFPTIRPARPRATTTSEGRRSSTSPSSSPSGSPSSSPGCSSPLSTHAPPPPTAAAFDVRAAAEKCRSIEGYVSFMDIAGLGAPPGTQDEDAHEDADAHRRWSWDRWFGVSGSTVPRQPPAKS